MTPIETDPETQSELFQVTDGEIATDNVYCEQPCADASGNYIVVRQGVAGISGKTSTVHLAVVDLRDGSLRPIGESTSIFPGTAHWGEWIYFVCDVDGRSILFRSHFQSGEQEQLYAFDRAHQLSHLQSISLDERYYVTCLNRGRWAGDVVCVDLKEQSMRTLFSDDARHVSHAEIEPCSRNRVSFLTSSQSGKGDGNRIHVVDIEGGEPTTLPIAEPHSLRFTGHYAWIGDTGRIFASCRYDEAAGGNLFTAAPGDDAPAMAARGHTLMAHVSVSKCGRFWIADGFHEPETPLYVGSFRTGRYRRLVSTRTTYRGPQEAHTHPYFTADLKRVVFTSDRSGLPQVYATTVPEGFLERLDDPSTTPAQRLIPTVGSAYQHHK